MRYRVLMFISMFFVTACVSLEYSSWSYQEWNRVGRRAAGFEGIIGIVPVDPANPSDEGTGILLYTVPGYADFLTRMYFATLDYENGHFLKPFDVDTTKRAVRALDLSPLPRSSELTSAATVVARYNFSQASCEEAEPLMKSANYRPANSLESMRTGRPSFNDLYPGIALVPYSFTQNTEPYVVQDNMQYIADQWDIVVLPESYQRSNREIATHKRTIILMTPLMAIRDLIVIPVINAMYYIDPPH